ncbi:MAG TPA: 5-oxoprolinase subunit PxpB [Methylovirgula sp.]|nr:5-oxoprolinase subunit PxpB [Methylovirgula sp.]
MQSGAPRFLPAGEMALVVEFGTTIDPALNDRVRALDRALAAQPIAGIVETVPTYRSLMIHFDPRVLSTAALSERIRRLDPEPDDVGAPARHWLIPVCYDAPHAEDLGEVAAALGLSPEKVAALHAGAAYRVYMYGFAPGYVFLGGLPSELTISRRPVPRPPVAPGAVLIAGGQALIASIAMPTGWYDIGRTPAALFDPRRRPAFLVEIGDMVTFEPIDGATFAALQQAAAEGLPVARPKA